MKPPLVLLLSSAPGCESNVARALAPLALDVVRKTDPRAILDAVAGCGVAFVLVDANAPGPVHTPLGPFARECRTPPSFPVPVVLLGQGSPSLEPFLDALQPALVDSLPMPFDPIALRAKSEVLLKLSERKSDSAPVPSPSNAPPQPVTSTFFELSLDLLCTATEDFRFDSLSPSWSTTLGWSLDELRSKPFLDFCHPDDLDRTKAQASAMLAAGAEAIDFENRYAHKDGSYVWLSWKGVVRDGRFFAVARDITQQKQQQANLIAANSALSASNRSLQQFALVASHDLKEPLRTMANSVGILKVDLGDKLSDEQKTTMHYLVDACARMQGMVGDLLAFSRINKRPLQAKAVAMGDLLDTCLRDLQQDICDTDAAITHDELPEVMGQASQLRSVLRNLLANALKFNEGIPRVHVGVEDRGDDWRFSVTDNGIGLEMDYAEQVFDMFQRLESSSRFSGSGVGLAIAREVIERHKGRIWVRSMAGQGATFYFEIPKVLPTARDGES